MLQKNGLLFYRETRVSLVVCPCYRKYITFNIYMLHIWKTQFWIEIYSFKINGKYSDSVVNLNVSKINVNVHYKCFKVFPKQ